MWIDPDDYYLMLPVSRISSNYEEAFAAFGVGDIVTSIVMDARLGLLHLDINGVSS